MNLFYDPTIAALRQLVDSSNKALNVHNVVIDFDGEVIIDPETKYAGIDLNKFKFRTTVAQSVTRNARALKSLYETLVDAYNGTTIDISRLKHAA